MTHTRRGFFAGLAALTAGSGVAGGLDLQAQSAPSSRRIQTIIDLWGPEPRQSEALIGGGTPTYTPQGSAYSASGKPVWFSLGYPPIVLAHWSVIWNPFGNPQNGIRMEGVWLPGPPIVGEVTNDARNGPVTNGAYVTAQLQLMQQQKQDVYLLHTIRGNPAIFASTLTIAWDLS